MAKSTTKKRTQVKDLPKKETQLTGKQMKKVKGGVAVADVNGDGMPEFKTKKPIGIK